MHDAYDSAPESSNNAPSEAPPVLVEHFFRHEYGRTVAALARSFGASRIELIEDAVQSSMALALTSWAQRGVPHNPGAWLTSAARNAIIDRLRRQGIHDRAVDRIEHRIERGIEPSAEQPAPAHLEGEIDDDELRMLFVCCDPGLKAPTQLVLALKILCGFSVREIALRLFTGEEAIKKRIARGRQQFRALSPEMESPSPSMMRARLDAVHRILYLLFNEGYSSAKPDEPIRRELCEEAIRLTTILCDHPVASTESWALLALMYLHHARVDARRGPDGGLLLMEAQDRSRWDQRAIHRAMGCLMRAGDAQAPSRYQIEAAILLEHCTAPSYEATNWPDIVRLYEALDRVHPSPLHSLNRAIALAEWQGAEAGLSLLEEMTPPAWLVRYYLWDGTLGELYRRAGRPEKARFHLARAHQSAPTDAERAHIEARLKGCEPTG